METDWEDLYWGLAEFCKITDERWLEHLAKNDYKCGCTDNGKSDSDVGDPYFGVCREWGIYRDYRNIEKNLKRIQERFDKATKVLQEKGYI